MKFGLTTELSWRKYLSFFPQNFNQTIGCSRTSGPTRTVLMRSRPQDHSNNHLHELKFEAGQLAMANEGSKWSSRMRNSGYYQWRDNTYGCINAILLEGSQLKNGVNVSTRGKRTKFGKNSFFLVPSPSFTHIGMWCVVDHSIVCHLRIYDLPRINITAHRQNGPMT